MFTLYQSDEPQGFPFYPLPMSWMDLSLIKVYIPIVFLIGMIFSYKRKSLMPLMGLFILFKMFLLNFTFSGYGAFYQIHILSLIFIIFFHNSTQKERSLAARWSLGLFFIAGSLGKINSSYLSGFEFSTGDFWEGTYLVYKNYVSSIGASQLLVGLSIFIEFLMGVFVLIRPRWGGILTLFFAVIISSVHPFAIFIFDQFFLYFLLIMNQQKEASFKYKLYFKVLLFSVFQFLLFHHIESSFRVGNVSWLHLLTLFFYTFLIIGWIFIIKLKNYKKQFENFNFPAELRGDSFKFRVWLILLIIFILSPYIFNFPSPLGMRVFAGQTQLKNPIYLQSQGQFNTWIKKYRFIWGIKLVSEQGQIDGVEYDSVLYHPLERGSDYMLNYFCKKSRKELLYIKPGLEQTWKSCNSL